LKIKIEITDKKIMEYIGKKQSTFYYWKKREPKLYKMAIVSFVISEVEKNINLEIDNERK